MESVCNSTICSNYTGESAMVPMVDWPFLVKIIFSPVVALVGIVGNCLSFIVMKRRLLRQKSYSHYLCALAIFDSMSLMCVQARNVDELLPYLHKPRLFTYFSEAGCKLYIFTECMCFLMSSWIIVCMAVERLIVVFMPFKKHALCTQRGAVVIILAVFVIMSYTQMFRLIMVTKQGNTCAGRDDLSIYLSLHIYFYQMALCFILPIVIVSTCNIMVLCKIRSVSRAMADENSSSTRLTRGAARRHKTTMMLLTICFMFIITLLPVSVVTTIVEIFMRRDLNLARSLYPSISPCLHLAVVWLEINYASNFFIYVVSGKNFRVELRRIFSRERGSNFSSSKTREEIMLL